MEKDEIYFYDGLEGPLVREIVMGERLIRWGYQDSKLDLLRRIIYGTSSLSRLMGAYYNSRFSRRGILRVIEELQIDPVEFRDPPESFGSFNEFFRRHLKLDLFRPFDPDSSAVVSPAEGRILVYPHLNADQAVPVKGHAISVREMLGGVDGGFSGGSLAVIRLCPADYHRFHYPCAGKITAEGEISGLFHSVNPIALRRGFNVFGENKRSFSLLESPALGRVAFIEVGAFGVGSIHRSNEALTFGKMDERGYFEFGGSTVILVFQKGRISFLPELITHSREGIETRLRVGATIGVANSAPAS